MKMKSNVIYCLTVLFAETMCISPTYAQSSPSNPVSSVFEYLETNRVPTGYLLDAAVELADLHKFNGTLSNDNYSDIALFRNALATINSAKVNSTAASLNADNLTDALADTSAIQLGAAVFKYNFIVSNALSSGLINYQNGKVYDVYSNGIWQNPYDEAYTFVFTPSQFYHSGQSVHFRFDASHLYGNVNPISIEFDAGEENNVGYRSIVSPYETTIYYSSPGEKTIKMRVTLSGNIVLESHTMITVEGPSTAPASLPTIPTDFRPFLKLTDSEPVAAIVSYKSSHSGAVVRPFIFVEGFDSGLVALISAIGNVSSLWKRINNHEWNNGFYFSWFYDTALADNYDIKNNYDVFYVDWLNPYADIKDNAALLVDILDWINGLKQNSNEKNIIVGHSMGGLIVRYALCSMENTNHAHQTDCYVSYDTPHLGVNVPVGLQYALMDLYQVLYGQFVPDIFFNHTFDRLLMYILYRYNCTSAKQMMYYFVPGASDATDAYHVAWQNELDSIGFPQGDSGCPIENLSIVNGGVYPFSSTPDPVLLDFAVSINNGSSSTLWLQALSLLATRMDNIDLSFQVNRDSGSGNVCVSKAKYRKTWPWAPNGIDVPLFAQDSILVHQSPSGSQGLDYVNSSYIENNLSPINTVSNSDTVRLILDSHIQFVPAASALSVPNYSLDYYSTPPTPKSQTPFDSYYLHKYSKYHSLSLSYFWDWIQVQRSVELFGPNDFVLSGDAYSVFGIPSDYNNSDWSLSTGVSVNNGIVSVINPGTLATIHYRNKKSYEHYPDGNNYYADAYIHKHRTVLAGFPAMTLHKSLLSGNQYTITATCTSTDSEIRDKLDELASSGTIKYIWGYKNPSTESYTWTDTTSTRSFVCTAPEGQVTYVCLKLHNGLFRESSVSDIKIDRRSNMAFFYEPTEVWSTQQGALMYYNDLQGTSAATNQYFAVWRNSSYRPVPPQPNNIQVLLDTIPLEETFQTIIDGENVTVYCFDFVNALDLPSPSLPQSFGPLLTLITIRHDNMNLQQIVVPICW